MEKKPTILVIGKEDRDLLDLQEKYNLIFREANYLTSPFVQAKEIRTSVEDTPFDGVIGFTDLGAIIAAIIAEQCHLFGPSPSALYLAQNKAMFSQSMQKAHLPYPETMLIDITSPTLPSLTYPAFIKPIKGTMSSFAFMLGSQQEFQEKLVFLTHQKREIDRPFELFFLDFSDAHTPLQNWYQVQPFIDVPQYTVDAFVFDQKVQIIGVVQSIYTEDRRSFKRFDFPGDFPKEMIGQLQDLLEKVVKTLEFDHCGFDLEFFLTPEGDFIIIELNTRISQGFNALYKELYLCSPKEMVLDLCLGHMPSLHVKATPRNASSFPLRIHYDCRVIRVPTAQEIATLKSTFDIAKIDVTVQEGKKLSDYWQDSYSYRYALLDIAGENLGHIKEKFTLLLEHLPIELRKIESDEEVP